MERPFAEILKRWAYCRCSYARAPMDPCKCDDATIARAMKETPAQVKRWERTILARESRKG